MWENKVNLNGGEGISLALIPLPQGNAIAIAQIAGQPVYNGYTFIQAYGNLGSQVGSDLSNARQDQAAHQDLVTHQVLEA